MDDVTRVLAQLAIHIAELRGERDAARAQLAAAGRRIQELTDAANTGESGADAVPVIPA